MHPSTNREALRRTSRGVKTVQLQGPLSQQTVIQRRLANRNTRILRRRLRETDETTKPHEYFYAVANPPESVAHRHFHVRRQGKTLHTTHSPHFTGRRVGTTTQEGDRRFRSRGVMIYLNPTRLQDLSIVQLLLELKNSSHPLRATRGERRSRKLPPRINAIGVP